MARSHMELKVSSQYLYMLKVSCSVNRLSIDMLRYVARSAVCEILSMLSYLTLEIACSEPNSKFSTNFFLNLYPAFAWIYFSFATIFLLFVKLVCSEYSVFSSGSNQFLFLTWSFSLSRQIKKIKPLIVIWDQLQIIWSVFLVSLTFLQINHIF